MIGREDMIDKIILGDYVDVMKTLPENSIDCLTLSAEEKCRFPDCDKSVYNKGYCLKHAVEMEDWAYSTYMDNLHEPLE